MLDITVTSGVSRQVVPICWREVRSFCGRGDGAPKLDFPWVGNFLLLLVVDIRSRRPMRDAHAKLSGGADKCDVNL